MLFFPVRARGPKYSTLENWEECREKGPVPTRNIWRRALDSLPWIISLCLASLVLLQLLFKDQIRHSCGTFHDGYATDFGPARSQIDVQRVQFNGSPSVTENGTFYVPYPDPIRYVGNPSPEIDRAWEDLTWGCYVLISEKEAHDAWGDEIDEFWDDQRGGYVAGLVFPLICVITFWVRKHNIRFRFDMFHTLHCLNQTRHRIHSDYYPIASESKQSVHQGHCIEQIRQYIMCSGDMTPIPTKYYSAVDRNYVDSDRLHTCRNFAKLQAWMVNRYDTSPIIPTLEKPANLTARV